jgi:hypothetical protein
VVEVRSFRVAWRRACRERGVRCGASGREPVILRLVVYESHHTKGGVGAQLLSECAWVGILLRVSDSDANVGRAATKQGAGGFPFVSSECPSLCSVASCAWIRRCHVGWCQSITSREGLTIGCTCTSLPRTSIVYALPSPSSNREHVPVNAERDLSRARRGSPPPVCQGGTIGAGMIWTEMNGNPLRRGKMA